MQRYALFLLLVLINVLSYVDRHLLPAFATQISADLDLSRQQFGLLTGFAFVTVYAVSGPLMGVLADRFNPSRVIACGVVLWSIMTCLTGMANNFVQILLPRMAIGVGEATLHPAAAGILGRLFTPRYRATVFGLFFMGSQIGLGLAYWLAGTFGDEIGWRRMFFALGALGMLLATVLLLSARGAPRAAERSNAAAVGHAPPGRPVRAMLGELAGAFRGNAEFRTAVLGLSLIHMIYASGQFTQLWLVAEKGLEQSIASSMYGSVYLMCAIPASMLGGVAADWFVRRFATTRALFIVLVMAVCGPLLIVFRLSEPGSMSFQVGMVVAVLLLAFPYGAILSTVLDHAPAGIQSTAVGFTMFMANVLVIGTGTFAIGFVADLLEAQRVAAPLTRALLCADALTLLAVLFYLKLHRATRHRRSAAEESA